MTFFVFTRWQCPYLALSCAMAQPSNTSSSHSQSSCSRDRTCLSVAHVEWCHLAPSLLSWLAAERCDWLTDLFPKLFCSDLSAIMGVKILFIMCDKMRHISYLQISCLQLMTCIDSVYLCVVAFLSGLTDGDERLPVLWQAQSLPRHICRVIQVSWNDFGSFYFVKKCAIMNQKCKF